MMTPDERRQRAAIDRACQRYSDDYDRAQTKRGTPRYRVLAWRAFDAVIGGGLGLAAGQYLVSVFWP